MSPLGRRTVVVALVCLPLLLVVRSLHGQWAAKPNTTVRNEFGPELALIFGPDLGLIAAPCRGACGPGCPDSCEEDYYTECVDSSRFRVVQTLKCGTNAGCRQHDDCLDKCSLQGSVAGMDFYVSECALRCHVGCPWGHGAVSCAAWIPGWESPTEPFDGYTTFEYTKDPPGPDEPLYRCPDGTQLVCTAGRGRCEPDDPADPPEPSSPGDSRPIAVVVAPAHCVERDARRQMFAEVIGPPGNRVTWSVTSGPGEIDRHSGWLTPKAEGTVTVRAASVLDPSLTDEMEIKVGGCACEFSASLSGDTNKTRAEGRIAHFSTTGGTTIMGAFTNFRTLGEAMGRVDGQVGPAAMPRETLGIMLLETGPEGSGAELLASVAGGFKLEASVMNDPIEPGFAGELLLRHVRLHAGDYAATGTAGVFEWVPGAPGDVRLTVSHYAGRSLSGRISGTMIAPELYKRGTNAPPRITFSTTFYALDFDPKNRKLGCLGP